ncbi:MAG: biotin--[acetyl-CoA-carboxylase] ligase [Limnochordaceae bacterium]|nr:biotin--[acetyl-CoA-carboxylase] ligase [Limnochordaceae bacterium]
MSASTAPSAPMVALRRALQPGRPISGQSLARSLGVSRTAVWKMLEDLRAWGYRIDAAPRRGYRLVSAPDLPLPWEVAMALPPSLAGLPVHFFPVVGSTNDEARRLAEAGGPAGTVVVADRQTSGRGRRGRTWVSPPGGLYFSVLVRPQLEPRHVSLLSLASAVAVTRAVQSALPGAGARVKWPNDVIAGGRKLAGILAELSADQETVRFAVIGIGINVETPELDPAPAAGGLPPIGLRQLGWTQPRAEVLGRVLAALHRLLGGFEPRQLPAAALVAEASSLLAWKGEEVEVQTPSGSWRGRLAGLAGDGALVLERAGGVRQRLYAGDVTLREAGGPPPTDPGGPRSIERGG